MPTDLERIEVRPARRRFLQGAAALAAATLAPGVLLYQAGAAAKADARVRASGNTAGSTVPVRKPTHNGFASSG